jgi:16S rRNA (guanine(966)-N(2))-methyltransferase RsmD
MRIIAGELKGRRIETPTWDGLRPTSDRLRETLFNVLAPQIRGARVLDGFAGTGAVGIEALSRGAASVTFVESDPRAVRLITANLGRCGIEDRYAIIPARLAEAAPRLSPGTFDIIFLDPPYGPRDLRPALAAADGLTSDATLVVVEHARRDAAPEEAGALIRVRELTSGDSALAFYRRRSRSSAVSAPSNR